jgi:hypothetical protein
MGRKVNRHKVTQPCLTNLRHYTHSEIHCVSQNTKYEVKEKVLDSAFYETLRQIKQKHCQSLQLFATTVRAGRPYSGEINDLPGLLDLWEWNGYVVRNVGDYHYTPRNLSI